MIDENRQDLAAEYALDALDPESARAFERLLASDPELKALTDQLRETAALLAHDAPASLPPPELREKVLSHIRAEAEAATASPAPATAPTTSKAAPSSGGLNIIPWAVAAGFAITTGALWMERDALQKEAASLKTELVDVRTQNAFAKMKIAMLSAQVDAYAKTTAVVVWDPNNHKGVLKLANVPPAETGKDYQLWLIGAKHPPMSAGVVAINADGAAQVDINPGQPVKAERFAISIEPTGGVPAPTGQIVLASK